MHADLGKQERKDAAWHPSLLENTTVLQMLLLSHALVLAFEDANVSRIATC